MPEKDQLPETIAKMRINGQHFHSITANGPRFEVLIIDQQKLPFQINMKKLKTFNDCFRAIAEMEVRGAPLIGVTAAYGIWLGLKEFCHDQPIDSYLSQLCEKMKTARPTAINLAYAVDRLHLALKCHVNYEVLPEQAFRLAEALKAEEISASEAIGVHGCQLIEKVYEKKKGQTVNILTHCNAGWLACIDWGTALAPVYKAHQKGIPVHVWVDETRPRNQGSKLTAFELHHEGVPHTVIDDNTGGHLMQHGMVDLVLVGSDRTSRTGDVCNKIGTYLKALAAADNNIPFYVALPLSSIDLSIRDGLNEIPIEIRHPDEVLFADGEEGKTRLVPHECTAANYGFDVTPARLVAALITEKGVIEPNEEAITAAFSATTSRISSDKQNIFD